MTPCVDPLPGAPEVHEVELSGLRFRVRPVTLVDEHAMVRLLERASPEEIHLRFFRFIRCFGHEVTGPLVQADDTRHVGLVALNVDSAPEELAGSAMLVRDEHGGAEFALLVNHEHAHHGLGRHLLECLLAAARRRGVGRVYGLVLRENAAMLQLAHEMDANVRPDPDEPDCMRVEWVLG